MLVLTRKKDQTILIGNDIKVSILEISGDHVRLGISAPKNISILREEIIDAIKLENKTAMSIDTDLNELSKLLKQERKK